MQRHRNHRIGLNQNIRRRAGQPTGEQAGKIGPIGVLELQDQVARMLVVETGGPRAVERRFAALAGHAKGVATEIIFERRAATVAERRIDEGDSAPILGGHAGRLH